MSTQTDHWRKIAIKLIQLLVKHGVSHEEIAKHLGIETETIAQIHWRWGKKYLQ